MAEGYEPKPTESYFHGIGTSTDCNDFRQSGFFPIFSSYSNSPGVNANMMVINNSPEFSSIDQIVFTGNSDIYMRRYNAGNATWNEWRHVSLS